MKPRLFKKYFFTTTLIILFSLSMMMMILIFVLNSYFAKTKYSSLGKSCDSVAEYIGTHSSDSLDEKELFNIMNSVSEVAEIEVFVTGSDGRVMICGCGNYAENGEVLCDVYGKTVPKSILGSITEENVFQISSLQLYENPRYVSARCVSNGTGESSIYIFSTTPISAIRTLLNTILKLLVFSALIPIIIMFFAMFAITYRLTKPLKMMSEATKAMAKGDFSKRIPVTSDDEIGELAISFNQMTNSLVQLENMRRSFVANVSHELKTPMTTIGGFIDGIIDGTIEYDKQQYYLQIVSQEIKRLSRLVQSMLSMAKLESGEYILKPELFDFRELLCTIVISQEQRIERNSLNITGLDTIQSVSVKADKDFIHQVIYNLVDNAVKFTDDGGTINFSLKSDSRKLLFEITNTGKGIPQNQLDYVFERFYKVDKSRSANKNSTGLGLYIAKTIISAHGGTISVASKENEFTTFKVILPLE